MEQLSASSSIEQNQHATPAQKEVTNIQGIDFHEYATKAQLNSEEKKDLGNIIDQTLKTAKQAGFEAKQAKSLLRHALHELPTQVTLTDLQTILPTYFQDPFNALQEP